MAGTFDRETIVRRLRAERDAGRAIYDALCGSGITAKMAARGGASMVTTHALAYFRMQGLSSMAGYLPICDANALTLELGERALRQRGARLPADRRAAVRRSDPRHGALSRKGRRRRLPRRDELPDRRADRRQVPQRPGGDRHGLRARGRRAGRRRRAWVCSPRRSAPRRTRRWPWRRPASTTSSSISATARAAPSARRPCWRTTRRCARAAAILDALAAKFSDRIITCHGGAIETPGRLRAISCEPSRACTAMSAARRRSASRSRRRWSRSTRAFRAIRLAEGPLGGGRYFSRRPRHARQQARGGALRLRRACGRPASRRGWSTCRCGRTRMTSPMSAGRRSPRASGTTWDALGQAVARRRGADHDRAAAARSCERGSRPARIDGVLGVGGANGSTMACAIMRQLPLAFPKAMVTPVAATAAVQWYVAESDIAMFPTIGDIWLNRVTRAAMANAAAGGGRHGAGAAAAALPTTAAPAADRRLVVRQPAAGGRPHHRAARRPRASR